jgi:hypothetical protein
MNLNEATGGRRRWYQAWRTGVLAVTGGLVLLTAACGGSSGTTNSPSASTASANVTSRLAYVHCVRAHGVPNYPDPDSNGQEPPGTKQLFVNNPQFQAASGTCKHLLPNGGLPTQAPQANALTETGAVKFAIDSAGQPVFNVQAAGIAPHSPQLLTTLHRCLSLLHLTGEPQTSS